jgi:hypothetical protein
VVSTTRISFLQDNQVRQQLDELKQQIEELRRMHESEKVAMASSHRENLLKGLEEAEKLWQKVSL